MEEQPPEGYAKTEVNTLNEIAFEGLVQQLFPPDCRNCIRLYLARTRLLKFILVMDAIGTRQALEINGSTLHRRCGYGRTA